MTDLGREKGGVARGKHTLEITLEDGVAASVSGVVREMLQIAKKHVLQDA